MLIDKAKLFAVIVISSCLTYLLLLAFIDFLRIKVVQLDHFRNIKELLAHTLIGLCVGIVHAFALLYLKTGNKTASFIKLAFITFAVNEILIVLVLLNGFISRENTNDWDSVLLNSTSVVAIYSIIVSFMHRKHLTLNKNS